MYFGSVRFFKHLILLGIMLIFAAPTVLSLFFLLNNASLQAEAAALEAPPGVILPAVQAPTDPVNTPDSGVEGEVQPTLSETPSWTELYPDLYAPAAQRNTVDEDKTVYLTFDDGPSVQTPKILEILERYNVKATFFVVGTADEQSQQWMRDIVAAGHTLGIHSYSHNYEKIYASVDAFLEDYNRVYNLIFEVTGTYPVISRFPGGSINGFYGVNYQNILSEVVRRGFVYFDWNVDSGDAAETGLVKVEKLVDNALSRVDSLRRAVVLMHDSARKSTTVEALPAIIEGYRDAGFTFAPLTAEVAPVIYGYPD